MPAIEVGGGKDVEAVVEVLVTGFGPFGRVKDNPSFLCTKDLHDLVLNPVADVEGSSSHGGRRIHVQVIQTSVAYSQVLDLVPRIHGSKPSSPDPLVYMDPDGEQPDAKTGQGAQGNGSHFPLGYRDVSIPPKGYWDHVVHFGVGLSGSVAIETLAHKRGYQLPDVRQHKAPMATDQSPTKRRGEEPVSAAEKGEQANMQVNGDERSNGHTDPVRGFGQGYEIFNDELQTTNDVEALVTWLKGNRLHPYIRQSLDPGRFLCDYIFYCSLAEQQRTGNQTGVQFVHVPPLDSPYSLQDLQRIAKDIVRWIGSQ